MKVIPQILGLRTRLALLGFSIGLMLILQRELAAVAGDRSHRTFVRTIGRWIEQAHARPLTEHLEPRV